MTTPFDTATPNQSHPPLNLSLNHTSPSTSLPPFPTPTTFTFLPQLYTLISRLTPIQPASTQINGTPASTTRASRSPTLTRHAPDATELTTTRSNEAIEPKDLPALVYPIRQAIERAREVVRALPDVGRGVEEQEREIMRLEGRIEALKGRVGELGGLAGEIGEGDGRDVVMKGVEGRDS